MITGHLPELMLVLVLGLIVFGPKRLPEIGEAMGKGIRSFKSGVSHFGDDSPAPVHSPELVPVTAPSYVEPMTPHPATSESHLSSH